MSLFFTFLPALFEGIGTGGCGYFPYPANASNILANMGTSNPPYTVQNFLEYYPQFGNISLPVITQFLAMANAAVDYVRWGSDWPFGMANYMGHFLTKYLQVIGTNPLVSNIGVISNAMPQGLPTSMAVGDGSISQDFGYLESDFAGWGDFKTTQYGIMFADRARLIGSVGCLFQ